MTSLDAVYIVILAAFLIRGLWTGFVSQLAFIAAMIVGFVAAGNYYGQLAPYIMSFVSVPQVGFILTFSLLFLAVYLLITALGAGLKKVVRVSFLGWFDRIMGGVLGLGKGCLIATLLFIVLCSVLSSSNMFLQRSYFYPFFEKTSHALLASVEDRDLRARFQPKRPAISSLFALQSRLTHQTKKRIVASQSEKLDEIRAQLRREARERIAAKQNLTLEELRYILASRAGEIPQE